MKYIPANFYSVSKVKYKTIDVELAQKGGYYKIILRPVFNKGKHEWVYLVKELYDELKDNEIVSYVNKNIEVLDDEVQKKAQNARTKYIEWYELNSKGFNITGYINEDRWVELTKKFMTSDKEFKEALEELCSMV